MDIALGTVGITQLGQMGFVGCGAYVGAVLATKVLIGNPLAFWISIPIAFILSMLLGLLIGMATLRLQGIFFALCTLGFGEIMRTLYLNLVSITDGPYGIKAIPNPMLLGLEISNKRHYYYLLFTFVSVAIWVVYSLRNSKYGLIWRSIREDEIVSATVGINVFKQKNVALAINAGISAVGC